MSNANKILITNRFGHFCEYSLDQNLIEGERWRPVPVNGFEHIYSISSCGRLRRDAGCRFVKRTWPGKIIVPGVNGNGYTHFTLREGKRRVTAKAHRLVAAAFIQNPLNLPTVNHIDGNKVNPSASNLEWVTEKENTRHATITGLMNVSGEHNPSAKITASIATSIRAAYANGGFTYRELAQRFGLRRSQIGNIVTGICWRTA